MGVFQRSNFDAMSNSIQYRMRQCGEVVARRDRRSSEGMASKAVSKAHR